MQPTAGAPCETSKIRFARSGLAASSPSANPLRRLLSFEAEARIDRDPSMSGKDFSHNLSTNLQVSTCIPVVLPVCLVFAQ